MSEVRLPRFGRKGPEAEQPSTQEQRQPVVIDRLATAVAQEVEVSLEALRELGLLVDEDADREMLTQHYVELRSTSFQGELYPQISLSDQGLSFGGLLGALDGRRHPLVESHQAANVWHDSYTHNDLSALGVGESTGVIPVHGRLAVANFANPAVDEPLLHFRGHPFDENASKRLVITHPTEPSQEIYVDVPTQQEMLAGSQENVRQIFHGYNLAALNLPAVCVIMLQRRIRGEPLPFQGENQIHIPQLRRIDATGIFPVPGQVPTVMVHEERVHIGVFGDSTKISPQTGIGLSLGRNLSE